MADFQAVNQAVLVVLVLVVLFFAVRSVMNTPVREGMDTKDAKQSLASKITAMKKLYDDLIKKDAPSKNQKLAALQDAKDALSSAGIFASLNAFSGTGGDDALKDAAALVAMRQLIDQAISDVKSGGSSGGSSMSFGGGGKGKGDSGSWL
tara:strand:- start:185 stop:634 length:450 start_codon:yes stop_codon:yes gene_type:complete